MQECLGINILNRVIKYSKVQQNNNEFKVLSSGIKFFDMYELEKTVENIIQETNSTKTPISINIDNEKYYYFDFFNLTNKGYVTKAIETEFESFCVDNHFNRNALEGRYIYSVNPNNSDKNKVIYIYESKGDLNERLKPFNGTNLISATPMPTSLTNIAKMEKNKNIMIVDINEKTTVTTILNQNIYNIDTLEVGMEEAFSQINLKENSLLKTYEVCKNTTIYTMEMQQSTNTENDNEYLQIIVPCLYNVAQEIKNIIKNYKKIDQVYLTGMATVINNIDLYFQEFILDSKVEILKPFFAENDSTINIKDYIEVNSAIALAIQGLGFGAKTLNFATEDKIGKLKSVLAMDVKDFDFSNLKLKPSKLKASKPNIDFSGLEKVAGLVATSGTSILVFVLMLYCIGVTLLGNEIENKKTATRDVIADTESQIASAQQDDNKITQRTADYVKYKTNLENINTAIETKRSRKNQIPNLLNKIIYNIPKEVQLTEIKNKETTTKGNSVQHILIYAQSKKYEQLAYFKARLKNANILDNIVSTEGTKDENEDIVKTVIEGDLRNY